MKYQKARAKKFARITRYIQREIEIGKCDGRDVTDLFKHLKMNITPHAGAVTENSSDA